MRAKKSLCTRLLKPLAAAYLRREIKRHIGQVAACVLAMAVLLSLCLALRHTMGQSRETRDNSP